MKQRPRKAVSTALSTVSGLPFREEGDSLGPRV